MVISVSTIDNMVFRSVFGVEPMKFAASQKSSTIEVALSLVSGEELPISGFPRALTAEKDEQRKLIDH